MADLVLEGIDAVAEMLMIELNEYKNRVKRRKRKIWTREWILRRSLQGASENFLREVELEDHDTYKNHLRLTRLQFQQLLELISTKIQKQNTTMRAALPARIKLQITLRYLATGDCFRSLECLYRVPKSTISKFIPTVLDAIYEALEEFIQVYGSANEIPEENLRSLGWIVKGITPNAFSNMSFTDIDTIAAFGRYFELNPDQLAGLRDAVMDQWSSKDVSDLSSFDLANLGHILCAFNVSDISRIHADAYRDAASELSLLKDCSADVIKGLANLAVSPHGFGDPTRWTALQVSSIGCVIAGVPYISSIPSEAFKGISPDIVNCLPKSFFKSMTAAQLKLLPATSGMAVNEEGLSSKQGAAIEEAISGPTLQNSSNNISSSFKSIWSIMLTVILIQAVQDKVFKNN